MPRPKKENAKSDRLTIRLGKSDMDILFDVSCDTGETYVDIIRKALRVWYRLYYREGKDG